jgi:hypothetical protein
MPLILPPAKAVASLQKWLQRIHLGLRSDLRVVLIVVVAFDIHVVHEPDRQKVQILDGNSELDASEQEKRSG